MFNDDVFLSRKILGTVEPGMPEVSLPPFEIDYHNRTLSFTEVCAELGSGIIVVPLVAVLANVAIAKAFSKFYTLNTIRSMAGNDEFLSSFYSKWNGCRCIPRNDNTWFV